MGQWLCLDHGSKRIGVATGNSADGITVPVTVLSSGPMDVLANQIAGLLQQYACDGVVVGWPLNMDGTEGPQGQKARTFAAEIAGRLDADVRMWDERLSSFQADNALAGQLTRMKRRKRQDAIAAAGILEDFFARNGPEAAPAPELPSNSE